MKRAIRILQVANKRLPESDYRLGYRLTTSVAQVTYGLPGRPACLRADEYVSLDFGEGLRLRDLSGFWALFRYLVRNRREYDFVHFFSTKLQLLGPFCAALAGVPCLTTFTGFGRVFNRCGVAYRLLRLPYLVLARGSISLSRAAFFQNHGDMQWLSERFPSLTQKMFWIGSAVKASPVRNKEFARGPLRVLLAGRLMPDKGIPLFLECAARLKNDNFLFLLAGPASDGQQRLLSEVARADRNRTIEYLKELSPEDLAAEYGRCHVLIHPSRGEGMPRVMLEAGHHLICPIASDIPAHRDLIAGGRGFLLDSDQEVESMIRHLQVVQADRAECERNARAYQKHILKHYTIQAYAHRMDTFLQSFLPERDAAESVRLAG